jgi:hypothetical protein
LAASPWGTGDIVAICVGAIYLPLGLWLLPVRRTAEGAGLLLATGISLGPLLMIVCDPFVQVFGGSLSLLNIVMQEGRATLWWASAVATIHLVRELFSSASARFRRE